VSDRGREVVVRPCQTEREREREQCDSVRQIEIGREGVVRKCETERGR
jgi:hypothetical protein